MQPKKNLALYPFCAGSLTLLAFGSPFKQPKGTGSQAVIPIMPLQKASIAFKSPKGGIRANRGTLRILSPDKGLLAHSLSISCRGDEPEPSYLLLHRVVAQSATTSSFEVKRFSSPDDWEVWSPQFSPTGRYLLFKYGVSRSFEGPFDIFVFDTETHQLRQVTHLDLAYDLISWSPDEKYIAFLKGGDALGSITATHGDQVDDIGPLQLMICNWRTGAIQEVVTNNSLRGPFDWSPPHTLVFGMLNDANVSIGPNVYEYSVEQKRMNLLFQNGFKPTPSPAGTRLAFFGSTNATLPLHEDWNNYPSNMALSVVNSDGTGRFTLSNEKGVFPHVVWLPDETHLLTLKQILFGKINCAQIKLWNIQTRKFRIIAELHAKDFKPVSRSATDPSFKILRLSADAKTLLVAVSELVGKDPLLPGSALLLNKTTVQGVDIASGRVTPIAQTVGDSGVDWFDGKAPPPTPQE